MKQANRILISVLSAFALMVSGVALSAPHPMDPLSAGEFGKVKEILKAAGHVDDNARYPLITLLEPPKQEVLNWQTGGEFSRRARLVVRKGARVFTAAVDIGSEKEAPRFRVLSSERENRVGNPTSYEVLPEGRGEYFLPESEWYSKRANFLRRHIWVTPHNPDERYAGGDFVFAGRGDDGLDVWTRRDRPIRDRDVVVWVNIGMNHFTRSEDMPVMPTIWKSFTLRPFNFFDRNPALDLRTEFAR